MNIERYFHTLRHLRPVQFYGRVWHRLNRTSPDLSAAPAQRTPACRWPGPPLRNVSLLDANRFWFLNVEGKVEMPRDWNATSREKLWLYNLHYFDDLNAAGADERNLWHRNLLDRWVDENPPGLGNGWEPYPVSLRLVNWVKWSAAGNDFTPLWSQSLAVQARWLRRHLEWHLLGNHLFVNAKALIFAGLFFSGDEAAGWLKIGLKILRRELPEQVLPDGCHFELSPMYHAIILEDLLDLIALDRVYPGVIDTDDLSQLRETVVCMLGCLRDLSHPDGEICFFNDAAFGVAAPFAMLLAYAQRLRIEPVTPKVPIGMNHFSDAGYVRLERGEAVGLLDVARIGPDYLPGHAHADTLSFELSLYGQRLFVNSGTSQYGVGNERLRQRGTAAHNTLEIDGSDSSEVWGGFRVARRAKPLALKCEADNGRLTVSCAHDGYLRLPGHPVPRRVWCLSDNKLEIRDSIDGDYRTAIARYYLHPAVSVTAQGAGGRLLLPHGQEANWAVNGGVVRVVPTTWHPQFGVTLDNQCIEVELTSGSALFTLTW